MSKGDDQDARIFADLATGSAAAWEAFVRLASGPAWSACLRAAPHRTSAERLFSEIFERLRASNHELPGRFAISGLPSCAAYLAREIDEQMGTAIAAAFRDRSREAADWLARYFGREIKIWVQRAAAPGQAGALDDRVQDVYAALLEDGGRRVAAYPGGGDFRAFLRRVALNALMDAVRHEHGRARPKAAIARLTPLQREAYSLVYEQRLSSEEATRRLDDPEARQAVEMARKLGDLGPATTGARPRLVAFEEQGEDFDPPSHDRDPEAALIHAEEVAQQCEREHAVLAALREEPDDVRRILEARFLDGSKPREIAQLLGRDVKDIHRILERALVRLKKHLVRPS